MCTLIPNNAFDGCENVKKVVIGKGVMNIGKNAFLGLKNIEEIVYMGSSKDFEKINVDETNNVYLEKITFSN